MMQQPASTTGLWDVAYGSGLFVAVGGYVSTRGGGTVQVSDDGMTWTSATPRTESMLTGVAYANGRFVMTGEDGNVLTADAVTCPRISGACFLQGDFQVTIPTTLGNHYTLESSDSITTPDWQVLTNIEGTGLEIHLLDSRPASRSRFYRLEESVGADQ